MKTADDRIRDLLDEGRALLLQGRGRDAADVLGRVLLLDPHHPEARAGLAEARAAADERQRGLEVRLEQAEAALQAGDHEAARELLEAVLRDGGDRDRALSLLDRIEARRAGPAAGVLPPAPSPGGPEKAALPRARGRGARFLRHALATGWAVALGVTAVVVTHHWSRLLGWLERSPEPVSAPAARPTGVPDLSPGEQAVAQARRLLEEGDTAGALVALDGVSPDEPVYPFARQLRHDAEHVLKTTGRLP